VKTVQIVYIAVLAGFLLIYFIFHVLNMKKYREYLMPLNSRDYSYKALLAGCLGIVDALRLVEKGTLQANLSQKISMVFGSRNAHYYYKVHWAVKVFHLFLGVVLGALFCLLSEAGKTGLIVIPAAGTGLFFLADKTLDDQFKKRKMMLERDFPDFISKTILLMNAGMNARQAIERIVTESSKDTPLYRELQTVITDINAGIPESEAFGDFADRCRIKEITHFVSILQQNMRLGGSQMVYELKRMGTECWEMRKNVAKQLGETASSRLMIPLGIMLLAVVLICVAPVLIELGSIF
jgi:tight adherence protein C